MSARSYVRTNLMAPGGRERRRPENDTLRRLLQVGRMLAFHARTPMLNQGAANLAAAWDALVEELHNPPPQHIDCNRSCVDFLDQSIGTCELCGEVDHHLVDGVCPGCRPKIRQVAAEVPLGAEADVSHVLRPEGKP